MAQTKDLQKAAYPLPAYNFRVTLDGASISFAEVSGISLEYETATYRHGLSFVEGERITRHRLDKYVSVTLKRGVLRGPSALYDWLVEGGGASRNLEVSLCDETGTPSVTWRLAKAVPVKLEGPGFDATTNEAAVESLELMVAGIAVVHH